jgi:hypothetical protein
MSASADAKLVGVHRQAALDALHKAHEIPYINHFIWLFQSVLKVDTVTPRELEAAFLMPISKSTLLLELLTKLVLDDKSERNKLGHREHFQYEVVNELLQIFTQQTHARYLKRMVKEKIVQVKLAALLAGATREEAKAQADIEAAAAAEAAKGSAQSGSSDTAVIGKKASNAAKGVKDSNKPGGI